MVGKVVGDYVKTIISYEIMFILMSLNYDLVLFYCYLMLLNDNLLLFYGNIYIYIYVDNVLLMLITNTI